MTKQQKTLFLEFIKERSVYNNIYKPNKLYLNICYYLIKNKFVNINNTFTTFELGNLYDNLIINNEVITLNNYEEYEEETLKRLIGRSIEVIKKCLNNNKIFLLNYYNYNELIYCSICLDSNYNALDTELLNALNN